MKNNSTQSGAIKEVGGKTGRGLLYHIVRYFGYAGIRIIMFPTICYFLLMKKDIRSNLILYWQGIYPEKSSFFYYRCIYKHYAAFGKTLVDRFVLMQNPDKKLVLDNPAGQDIILSEINKGKGIILLCSHYGGYNLYKFLSGFITLPITLLMYSGNQIQADDQYSLEDRSGFGQMNFIDPEDENALFKAKNILENKGILAIMGDRSPGKANKNSVWCQLHKRKFALPLGPYYLAYHTDSVIIPIFIKRKTKEYEFKVTNPIQVNELAGTKKKEKINNAAHLYIKELQQIIESDPYQYFNFGTTYMKSKDISFKY